MGERQAARAAHLAVSVRAGPVRRLEHHKRTLPHQSHVLADAWENQEKLSA